MGCRPDLAVGTPSCAHGCGHPQRNASSIGRSPAQLCPQSGVGKPTWPLLLPAEGGDVPGGVTADLWAGDDEYLGAVHGAHHLPAAGLDSRLEEQAVEVDALIAQWIALVDVDHRRREPGHIVEAGERRPGQRVALVERLDPVADRAPVAVQVEQDAVVLGGRWALRIWPLPGDIGAERVETLDQAEFAVPAEFQPGGEGQISAAA